MIAQLFHLAAAERCALLARIPMPHNRAQDSPGEKTMELLPKTLLSIAEESRK
jgi:hypothetical protein